MAAIDDRWISYFGMMKQLLVDPGSENSSNELQEFCETRGIQLLMTAAQAPHSDGVRERHGAIVKDTLTRLIVAHPKDNEAHNQPKTTRHEVASDSEQESQLQIKSQRLSTSTRKTAM